MLFYCELQLQTVQTGTHTSIWVGELKTPLQLVGLLQGAIVFLSDLMRAIDVPVQLDFIGISSFGVSTGSLPR